MDGETALRWIFTVITAMVFLAIIGRFLEYAIFNIPGIVRRPREQEPKQRPQVDAAPAAPRKASGAVAVPDYGAFVEAQRPALDWLTEANDMPNVNPHIAAIGPSRSGKSTLVLALLTRRLGHIVITTPKSAADDAWGGFPAVRSGFDPATYEPTYAAIGHAWLAVFHELNLRNADPARPRTPITLVIDELTTSLYELKSIDPQPKLIRMWLMGASVGIRVVVMDPTMNVKGWGIEGRGDVRESILFVRTARDKSAHFFEWDAARNVAFNQRPFDTSDVPALAAAGLDPARLWVPTLTPPAKATPAQRERPPVTAEELADAMRAYRAEHGSIPSRAAMERRLYEYTGGAAYAGVTAVWDEAVALVEEG